MKKERRKQYATLDSENNVTDNNKFLERVEPFL